MMISKKIVLTGLLFAVASAGIAQEDIRREVDVTRAYEPSVNEFFKLGIAPDMTDTAQMRPDFHYDVTPRPLDYGFSVNPLTPAKINTVESRRNDPFYVKLGGGIQGQSLLDFRYSGKSGEKTKYGAYLNHYGQYGKIENDMGIDAPAFHTDNRAGAFADHRIGDDLFVSGDVEYDYRKVTRYGYYNYSDPVPQSFDDSKSGLGQYFHNVLVNAGIGHSFTRTDKFNFRFDIGMDYLNERYGYDQIQAKAGVLLGFAAGYDGMILVDADFTTSSGLNNRDEDYNRIFTGGLKYRYDNGDFRLMIGADYGYDKVFNYGGKGAFLPQLNLEVELADGGLVPFLDLQSRIISNDYGHLTRLNPYVASYVNAPNTRDYNGRVGIRGTVSKMFRYRIYGGYNRLKNNIYWVNTYDHDALGSRFELLSDDLKTTYAGLDVELDIRNAFRIDGSFKYFHHKTDTLSVAGGLPDYTAELALTYNYRNKFSATLGMELIGERDFLQYRYGNLDTQKADSAIDLYLNFDYIVNDRIGVFLQFRNMLNDDTYRYNHYKQLGFNGLGGVRISF